MNSLTPQNIGSQYIPVLILFHIFSSRLMFFLAYETGFFYAGSARYTFFRKNLNNRPQIKEWSCKFKKLWNTELHLSVPEETHREWVDMTKCNIGSNPSITDRFRHGLSLTFWHIQMPKRKERLPKSSHIYHKSKEKPSYYLSEQTYCSLCSPFICSNTGHLREDFLQIQKLLIYLEGMK